MAECISDTESLELILEVVELVRERAPPCCRLRALVQALAAEMAFARDPDTPERVILQETEHLLEDKYAQSEATLRKRL